MADQRDAVFMSLGFPRTFQSGSGDSRRLADLSHRHASTNVTAVCHPVGPARCVAGVSDNAEDEPEDSPGDRRNQRVTACNNGSQSTNTSACKESKRGGKDPF